jgi:hypothetical protein
MYRLPTETDVVFAFLEGDGDACLSSGNGGRMSSRSANPGRMTHSAPEAKRESVIFGSFFAQRADAWSMGVVTPTPMPPALTAETMSSGVSPTRRQDCGETPSFCAASVKGSGLGLKRKEETSSSKFKTKKGRNKRQTTVNQQQVQNEKQRKEETYHTKKEKIMQKEQKEETETTERKDKTEKTERIKRQKNKKRQKKTR